MDTAPDGALELREERLAARVERAVAGVVRVTTRVETFPGRLAVDVEHDDVAVERVLVGEVVQNRVPPWEEDGVIVVPLYEEQAAVPAKLTLVEYVRIRRVPVTEQHVVEEPLRRETLAVDDPTGRGIVARSEEQPS